MPVPAVQHQALHALFELFLGLAYRLIQDRCLKLPPEEIGLLQFLGQAFRGISSTEKKIRSQLRIAQSTCSIDPGAS